MDAKIFRVNYKSDFILTLTSDAGWMTPFCIKFWTGAPSQAFYASWDGETYTHCSYDPEEPTKLTVQFDDHHLPTGELKCQIAYHFTVDDFPNDTEDEVLNQETVTTVIDGETHVVMLDFTGQTAPEIQFSLPAYVNEQQRIENEQARIAAEQQRIENEQQRIENETHRENVADEDHRVAVADHEQAESDHTRAESDHTTASNDHTQAGNDHTRAESDHTQAGNDHTRAESDHTTASNDHTQAGTDHTRAGEDHTRAESDHTRAESDHASIEPFMDSLGAFDISAYHAEGGVLAKYANLSAALGTNGANIPEAIRKGGMSVKFVLSSDNKYVQYRLMSDTFNTTPTNWQGVDDAPTAGSNNLVVSGGVAAKKIDVSSVNLTDTSKITPNKYFMWSGAIGSANGYALTDYILVNGQDVIIANAAYNEGNITSGVVYDKNFIGLRTLGTSKQYTFQDGDCYVRFCVTLDAAQNYPQMVRSNYGTTLLPYQQYNPIDGYLGGVNQKIKDIEIEVNPNINLSVYGNGNSELPTALPAGQVSYSILTSSNAYASIYFYDSSNNILYQKEGIYLVGNTLFAENITIDDECVKVIFNRITSSNFTLKVETFETIDRSKVIQGLETIVGKQGSKKILYVKKDGTGDFTDIQSAINSINDAAIDNQYEIRVCDDFLITDLTELYKKNSPTIHNSSALAPSEHIAAIITKDYVNIVGYNRCRKIAVHSPYNLDSNSFQYVQTMWLQGNVTIENLDFEIKNGRYAIHQESGGNQSSPDYNAITTLKNVKATHLGNADSAAGSSAWSAICGQANGTCAGLKCIFENVEWSPTFYIHNNPKFISPTYFKFKNCNIIPSPAQFGEGYQGGYIDAYGCGQNFEIDIEGCNFLGLDSKINVAASNTLSDACHDIRTMVPCVKGYGNSRNAIVNQIYSKFVLCFETTENNKTVAVTGGTAKELIWGDDFFSYAGATDSHGFTCGTEYIGGLAFLLGKRLGNCTSENKTLIIELDGVEQTVTFNTDYTSMSNADVISAINAQLSGITATASSKDSSMKMYPYKECYEVGYNYTSNTIYAGTPLVRDIPNYLGWKICPNGVKPQGMACERINPNGNGKVAYLDKNLFKSIRDYAIGASSYAKASGGYWTAATENDADIAIIAPGIWGAV